MGRNLFLSWCAFVIARKPRLSWQHSQASPLGGFPSVRVPLRPQVAQGRTSCADAGSHRLKELAFASCGGAVFGGLLQSLYAPSDEEKQCGLGEPVLKTVFPSQGTGVGFPHKQLLNPKGVCPQGRTASPPCLPYLPCLSYPPLLVGLLGCE